MDPTAARQDFASDNSVGICPEACLALQEANHGAASSYGDDLWTARLREAVRQLFETDCDIHLTFSGTAANGLALAQLCQPFQSVVCARHAHIQTDECGAPEFFSGGAKLLLVDAPNGKIDLAAADETMAQQPLLHAQRPRALSVTQATEFGAVYRREELAAIAEFARARKMHVHMDGARFANAVAHLKCSPPEITWRLGIDILCFGGTKNGLAAGELLVIFQKDLAGEMDYRLKQAGQLGSKMRFLSAPWLGILENGVWLRNAQRANAAAQKLAALLRGRGITTVFPVEANAVFVRFNAMQVDALRRHGWSFYKFLEPDVYRLMCSWATSEEAIREFVDHLTAG